MIWVFDDGGREAAGFTGTTGDCVTRAIAIATGLPYRQVYNDLFEGERERMARHRAKGSASPRNGIHRHVYEEYLVTACDWVWVPTMKIGQGCTVHLRADELPNGRLIARLSKHVCAVIDGVIHDNYDPSRDGTRCVYGYFQPAP